MNCSGKDLLICLSFVTTRVHRGIGTCGIGAVTYRRMRMRYLRSTYTVVSIVSLVFEERKPSCGSCISCPSYSTKATSSPPQDLEDLSWVIKLM